MLVTATCAALVEEKALKLDDPAALELVKRWYAATSALRTFALERGAEPMDLVDVSTLAEMYLCALAEAA